MKQPFAVEVEGLSFSYQDTPILNQVGFEIGSGEFIGIIGPNGGGKTTLLKLIAGLYNPISGKILIFGKPPSQTLEQLAYVPQTTRFDKQFPISVLEVVLTGLLSHLPWYGYYSTNQKQAAFDALKKMGISHLAHQAFGTLSGGQAQRALISRALVSNPRLLLLDEPTASVDVEAQNEIYSLLGSLKGQMTIIMVTHDLKVALEKVDKVLCVQHQVVSLQPQQVCEHFAFGLYHSPLMKMSEAKR